LHHGAVLDRSGTVSQHPFTRGIGMENTGGAGIIAKAGTVPCYEINGLLRKLEYVALLKLDCEGSEWPILIGLREWARVGAICGEYHLHPADPTRSVEKLQKLLAEKFSFVRIEASNEHLGKFWASRVRMCFSHAHTASQRNGFASRRGRL
jgi:hypothetical protein